MSGWELLAALMRKLMSAIPASNKGNQQFTAENPLVPALLKPKVIKLNAATINKNCPQGKAIATGLCG